MNFASSANTPPIPPGPEIVDIQSGARNDVYAFVSRSGVFRRTDGQAWMKVLEDQDAAWGQIFRGLDGKLMLSNFGGGAVYVSSDEGQHWQKSGTSQKLGELNQIDEHTYARITAFCASGTAYVLSRDALLFSDDGGVTWHRRALPQQSLNDMRESQSIAANERVIFLLSGGILYKSENKAESWQVVEQAAGAASPMAAGIDDKAPLLRLGPDGNLLAMGPSAASQKVEISPDGGRTWHAERFGFQANAAFSMRLFGPNPDAAYFLIRSERPSVQPFKAIYRKPPAGVATEISFDANKVRKILHAPDGRLYVVLLDHSDALESTDGGKSWKGISHDGITW
jgi:hypothetical protein